MRGKTLLAGALLVVGSESAAVSSANQLFPRQNCNRDNLFRCFLDQRYTAQASAFCSGLTPFTTTVATVIATTTTIVQTQITLDPVFITETSTTTAYTETIPASTTTVTFGLDNVEKRQAVESPPKCMTNGVTYPASRISSACSCINVPAITISATYTAKTETLTHVGFPALEAILVPTIADSDYNLQILTSYTTPLATVTIWTTLLTATTDGVATVTVTTLPATSTLATPTLSSAFETSSTTSSSATSSAAAAIPVPPPPGTNRIVNGGFETGNADGWELVPHSDKGTVLVGDRKWSTGWRGTYAYRLLNLDNIASALQQTVYLEEGTYYFRLVIGRVLVSGLPSVVPVPYTSVVISNPEAGTIFSRGFGDLKLIASNGGIEYGPLPTPGWAFTVPHDGSGYYQVALHFTGIMAGAFDDISIIKGD